MTCVSRSGRHNTRWHSVEHSVCILAEADPELVDAAERFGHVTTLKTRCQKRSRSGPMWQQLRAHIAQHEPHIIHARTTGSWVDASLATLATPTISRVLSFHGLTTLESLPRTRLLANQWCARRADRIVTVSQSAADMLTHEWRIGSGKLEVIPNGIDTDRFSPVGTSHEKAQLRLRMDFMPDDRIVICVANHHPIKALDQLIRAWRQVAMLDPASRLVLVGDGPMRPKLEKLAQQCRCQESVRFLGQRLEVPDLLRCADAFVHPSRYEACSNAVLEAMATGLPIVATDIPGNRDLIEDGQTGWLVPVDQPAALAQQLFAVLRDLPAASGIAARARSVAVKEFGSLAWAQRYWNFYRQLATPKPSGLKV
jgi:glycosyltransferase involved in cell wall biosynthesis